MSVKYEDDGYDRVFPKAEANTSIVLDIQPEARDCTIGCSLIAKPRRMNYMLEGRLMEVRKGQRYKVSVLETGESEVKTKKTIRLMNKFNFKGKCVVVCSILGVFKVKIKGPFGLTNGFVERGRAMHAGKVLRAQSSLVKD